MAKPYFAKLFGNLDFQAVESLYHTAEDGRLRERLLMVLLSLEGKRASEIAEIVHRHVQTVLTLLIGGMNQAQKV